MATQAEMDKLLATYKECQDVLQKASTMAFDMTRQFGNMGAVAASGKAGALALADTLAAAPVGDAATVRNNIGALANEDVVTFKRVNSRLGLELLGTAYIDWHFGDDSDDYSSRLIATAKYQLQLLSNLTITGNVDQTGNLYVGGRLTGGGLGDLAYNNVGYNTYGTVIQKLIGDVVSKNFGAGTICYAGEMNNWDNSADNIYITGAWLCTSQVMIPSENKWLCTFIKCGS